VRGLALLWLVVGVGGSATLQRFSSGVEVVAVDVLVTEGRRVVTGLTADDFEVRDNGVAQAIRQVDVERLPLNIILVVDTSGSVAGYRLTRLKAAAKTLIGSLRERDRAALLAFSHQLQLRASLTSDQLALHTAVEGLAAAGATVLRDAAFAGFALRGSDPGRTLMLVFSDGVDTGSFLGADRILQTARKSDVVTYAVTVRDESVTMVRQGRVVMVGPPPAPSDDDFLEALTDETGGRLVRADRNEEIESAFARVLEEFRQRYVLSYTPQGVTKTGWHEIGVRLKSRKGSVTARRGYFAK
jgi:VWFA-related protein